MIQGTLNVNFFFKHHIPNKSNIFLSFKVNCRPSAVGTLSSFPLCLTSVSRSASSEYTLVLREVRATLMSVSRSISRVTFNSSRTANAFSLADSKPSAMILGWRPCKTKSKRENISEFSGGGKKRKLVRHSRISFSPLTHRGQLASAVHQWWGHLTWFRLQLCRPAPWQPLQWATPSGAEFAARCKIKVLSK